MIDLQAIRNVIWHPTSRTVPFPKDAATRRRERDRRADASAECAARLERVNCGACIGFENETPAEIERMLDWIYSDEGVVYDEMERAA